MMPIPAIDGRGSSCDPLLKAVHKGRSHLAVEMAIAMKRKVRSSSSVPLGGGEYFLIEWQ